MEIKIISGEGSYGHVEEYKGKATPRAIRAKLTRERCNGDRWARVEIDGYQLDDSNNELDNYFTHAQGAS